MAKAILEVIHEWVKLEKCSRDSRAACLSGGFSSCGPQLSSSARSTRFLDIFEVSYSTGYLIIEVLWDLADLAIAGVLAVLGFKVLRGDCFSRQLLA